jgi:hypothetical protein
MGGFFYFIGIQPLEIQLIFYICLLIGTILAWFYEVKFGKRDHYGKLEGVGCLVNALYIISLIAWLLSIVNISLKLINK